MKNIFKLSQILDLLFGINSEISFAEEDLDCEENLKWAEKYVLDTITLYGKKNIENVVMGSYRWYETPEGTCNNHIVVKYEVNTGPRPSTSWDFRNGVDTIIRYFNINHWGYPFKPPVVMHARKPFATYSNPSNAKNEEYPPYKCEQRLELEEFLARFYFSETKYPDLLSASTVFSRNTYPFCQYHIFFLSSHKNPENQEIEFSFDYVIRDESWYNNGYDGRPVIVGDRKKIKGRIIPDSELYPIR
jgi:hypothetical protein